MSEGFDKINLDDIDIPGRPDVVIKVMSVLEDEFCSTEKLEQVILEDPSITATLLKIANAPVYLTGRPIITVADSILSIGMQNVVALVSLAAIANQCLNANCDKDLIRHVVAVSAASSMLAGHAKKAGVKREVATVAGLLHDIGKLIMNISDLSAYNKARSHAKGKNIPFIEAEELLLGINHCTIGGLLAEKWKLPDIYRQVILHHHDENVKKAVLNDEEALSYIVRIADKLALDAGAGTSLSGEKRLADLLSCLGISQSACSETAACMTKMSRANI
ncbi:MAG TPA: HDOD domain-containing protein [Dissulfurispiraceae bacterium]|nr:HDOD domain-containing protein [Dissulfurispiraceae bacterium]